MAFHDASSQLGWRGHLRSQVGQPAALELLHSLTRTAMTLLFWRLAATEQLTDQGIYAGRPSACAHCCPGCQVDFAVQAAATLSGASTEHRQDGVHWHILRCGGVPLLTALLADNNSVRMVPS